MYCTFFLKLLHTLHLCFGLKNYIWLKIMDEKLTWKVKLIIWIHANYQMLYCNLVRSYLFLQVSATLNLICIIITVRVIKTVSVMNEHCSNLHIARAARSLIAASGMSQPGKNGWMTYLANVRPMIAFVVGLPNTKNWFQRPSKPNIRWVQKMNTEGQTMQQQEDRK